MYIKYKECLTLGIPYILYTSAINNISSVEAVIIPVLEPLLNPVWVFLFTGESPGTYAFLGGSIVIIAIITRGIYQQKQLIQESNKNFN